MKKKNWLFLLALLSMVSCQQPLSPAAKKNQEIKKQIDHLIGAMTLKEKIGMLHGTSKFTSGGVKRLGIPELHLSDGPHGVRQEIKRDSWDPAGWTNDSSSYFPTGTAVAATWNPQLSHLQGKALGEEARYRKKDIILGPGVNIIRTPLGGRDFEYMSEDPYLAARMCVPYIQGIQSGDVSACVKHYLGNNQEVHRGTINIHMSDRALHEIYLPAFKAAIEKGHVHTLMGAYNKFNGDWCCENHFLMTDLLRTDFGFQGITLSDWAAVHNTVKTANAGLDLEMGTDSAYNRYYFADKLLAAVKAGKVSESTIDLKVRHILNVMFAIKILGPDSAQRAKGSFVTPEHQQTAYKVATQSIVLLKNQGNLLPIQPGTVKTIAVIGDNATRKHAAGGNSSGLKAKYEITPLMGLQNRLGHQVKLITAQGYLKTSHIDGDHLVFDPNPTKSAQLLKEAVKAARKADMAIVFAGINHDYDTEALDKPDMKLPYDQEKLILEVLKANPKTIVVFTAGSPVNFAAINEKVPAILWGWYNGMQGGNALADVLTGKVNPSGKMPFTLPVKLDDSPAHALHTYPGKDLNETYEEGILVGYRWFDTKHIKPLYPFGYGLSYTTFAYKNLQTDKENYQPGDTVRLSFTLTNTGKVAGAEVAELYMNEPKCSVLRPAKELKGFQKVFLKAGESNVVHIAVPVNSFSFYSEKEHKWVLEPGRFNLLINSSAAQNQLDGTITVGN